MILIDLFDILRGIFKRRQVANMLCSEYSYKMDIAVKKEEAAEDKAEEIAVKMLSKKFSVSEIVELTGLSPDQVLKLQKTHTDKA